MNKIILASASPRRRELLEQLGVEFEIIPRQVEEKMKSMEPSRMVMELSEIKAEDIYNRLSQEEKELSTVIGAAKFLLIENLTLILLISSFFIGITSEDGSENFISNLVETPFIILK